MSARMLLINPRRRRKSSSRKTRSPAQRAATARMLAGLRASRGYRRNPSKRRRSATTAVSVARSSPRRARRARRSSGGGSSVRMSGILHSAKSLAMNGAIGAGGALTVDIAMGFAQKVLPATMTAPLNSDGSINYMYYAAKGGLALALGVFGRKLLPGYASRMAEGSFTVLAYELGRQVIPADVFTLGYYNPAPTMSPKLGAYQNVRRLPNNATVNFGGEGTSAMSRARALA